MPIDFARSLRSLEHDDYGRSAAVFACAVVIATVWTAWFAFAKVAVIEVAESARLEVDQAAHGLEAPVSGRVIGSRLVLGELVAQGDVLVELDAQPLRLRLAEQRAAIAGCLLQEAALTRELAAEVEALSQQQGVAEATKHETGARRRGAVRRSEFLDGELERQLRLRDDGVVSLAEALRAKAEASQARATLEEAGSASQRIQLEQRAAESDRRARIARLQHDRSRLEGQRAVLGATVVQLEYEIAGKQLRAPVAGRIGEVADVATGAYVREGDRLGAIIPEGTIRIVAEYLPASAIGRIHPGQTARMRPDGFPWTEFGTLPAVVRRVAAEPRSGRIRVELDVDESADSTIPLEHGLPGTLEIEVERCSPATLVLRAAGKRLATPTRPPTIADGLENPDGADGATHPGS